MTTILLTPAQAAEVLELTPATLQNWRVQGKGPPFVRLGRSVRYRRTDLEAWIAGLPARSSTAA